MIGFAYYFRTQDIPHHSRVRRLVELLRSWIGGMFDRGYRGGESPRMKGSTSIRWVRKGRRMVEALEVLGECRRVVKGV
jgi:hypothetical protein